MSKTLLDSEGLKLYDRLIKNYIANNAGGGSGDAIPKNGDRGVLAGFNTLNLLVDPSDTVVVNGSINDDSLVMVQGASVNISFAKGGEETWCKQIAVFNVGGVVTFNVPGDGTVLFDNATDSYTPGMFDLFVYVWYGAADIGIIYTKGVV